MLHSQNNNNNMAVKFLYDMTVFSMLWKTEGLPA